MEHFFLIHSQAASLKRWRAGENFAKDNQLLKKIIFLIPIKPRDRSV
jgi:hypothetical protein